MMELTGEIADGVVLNYCVPPEYNDNALELWRPAPGGPAARWSRLDRPQLIVCSVDHDQREGAGQPAASC